LEPEILIGWINVVVQKLEFGNATRCAEKSKNFRNKLLKTQVKSNNKSSIVFPSSHIAKTRNKSALQVHKKSSSFFVVWCIPFF